MLVERLLPVARPKLVTVRDDTPLFEVAQLLGNKEANLVVVCNSDDVLTGVIAKTDIVRQIGRRGGMNGRLASAIIMTRDVAFCRSGDFISEVWSVMKARGLKHVPVVNDDVQPIGLLIARDVLEALLTESEYEEQLLRDYVLCIGYQ
jgi:CBS domain-containing protein